MKVYISTYPFGHADPRAVMLLQENGIDFSCNTLGRRLTSEELKSQMRDCDVLIAGTEPITRDVLEHAPRLRLISRVGVGLDNIDLSTAKARGILVSYTSDAPSDAVAELTIALALNLLRHIRTADQALHRKQWQRMMGDNLASRTFGVIGVGRIGKRVIRHLRGGFPGTKVLANDIAPDHAFAQQYDVEWVAKDVMYKTADIISLHVPRTAETDGMIGKAQIHLMKPSVLLINTARGNMIMEDALADALRSGRIGGAAVDVFSQEPYRGPLTEIDNCILTCHMGSMSRSSRGRMEMEATKEAIRFCKGEALQNLIPDGEYP